MRRSNRRHISLWLPASRGSRVECRQITDRCQTMRPCRAQVGPLLLLLASPLRYNPRVMEHARLSSTRALLACRPGLACSDPAGGLCATRPCADRAGHLVGRGAQPGRRHAPVLADRGSRRNWTSIRRSISGCSMAGRGSSASLPGQPPQTSPLRDVCSASWPVSSAWRSSRSWVGGLRPAGTGVLAALIAAASPFWLAESQETRMYTVGFAELALAAVAWLTLMQRSGGLPSNASTNPAGDNGRCLSSRVRWR